MTAQTLTVTEFLLARIAEDERRLPTRASLDSADHRRARTECEAKRRIVYYHEADADSPAPPLVRTTAILEYLASVYADHPDFNPDWA